MRNRLLMTVPLLLAGIMVVVFFSTTSGFASQEKIIRQNPSPTQLPSHPREIIPETPQSLEPQVQTISFIDNPSPSCINLDPWSGVCYINWDYISVSAAPSYVISMTMLINGKERFYSTGFFQTSMTLDGEMFSPGFRVSCGFPNPLQPALGNSYSYEIRARSSDNTTSTNYGQVRCPSDIVRIAVPLILKH